MIYWTGIDHRGASARPCGQWWGAPNGNAADYAASAARARGTDLFWTSTEVGDTIRVWVVNVAGPRLFIEGDTHRKATPHLGWEIQQIVESISFD